jgi:hypothetical protein
MDIHAPRGNLVQQRLPHVRPATIDERDSKATLASESIAEAGRKLQAPGSATDYDDLMRFSHYRFTCCAAGE